MKKLWMFQVFVVLSLLMVALAFGQHELVVPTATGFDDVLNDVIAADTTSTGARVDSARVYVLVRGGMYFVNSSIRNDGWPLNIIGQEGEGALPVIYQTPTSTATNGFDLIRIKGDCYIKDVVYDGYLESDPTTIAKIGNSFVRTDAAGYDVVIDHCIVSNTQGQFIRTESAARLVKLTNNIFANMGDLGRSNFGAGKCVDFRGNSCDSAIFVNNTFVNFQDRIIRHRSSTAALNNLIFDHNTIINGFSYHGTLALGYVGDKVQITNNLWLDAFVAGQDTDVVRQSEFNECAELDDYGFSKMTWISSVPNDSTEWDVKFNYYAVSMAVQAFYDSVGGVDLAFKGAGLPLTAHIAGKTGVEEFVELTSFDVANRPEPMVAMAKWYRTPVADGGAGKTKATDNFDRATDDYDRCDLNYLLTTFDATYSTSSAAYTGASGGAPVGDLNWFPEFLGISKENPVGPVSFSLKQNYPNPFNPTTQITFNLDKSGYTVLSIYNLLGQIVAKPVANHLPAGSYQITFDASHLAGGIYFYKLECAGQVNVRKMMLLK